LSRRVTLYRCRALCCGVHEHIADGVRAALIAGLATRETMTLAGQVHAFVAGGSMYLRRGRAAAV